MVKTRRTAVVLWDMDGTMFDYHEVDRKATAQVLRVMATDQGWADMAEVFRWYEWVRQRARPHHHHRRHFYWKMMLQWYGCLHLADLHRYTRLYESEFLENIGLPFDGVRACMTWIRQQGMRNIVVSNNRLLYQIERLEKLGLLSVVDNIVTSDEAGVAKPHPGMWRYLRSVTGPCEIVAAIGDSWEHDIVFAATHGVPLVFWRTCLSEPPEKLGSVHLFQDFHQVRAMLSRHLRQDGVQHPCCRIL